MKKSFLFQLLCLAIGIAACQKPEVPNNDTSESGTPQTTDPGPTYSIEFPSTEEPSPVFNTEGGEISIKFTASNDWTSSVINDQADSWIDISPKSGESGSSSIKISVSANETTEERNATVQLKCGSAEKNIVVTQKQKNALTVTPDRFDVPGEGADITVEIISNISFDYKIEEDGVDWIREIETRSMNRTTVQFSVAKNDDVQKREGTITISSGAITEVIKICQESGIYVEFADAKFEDYCISRFDVNGDKRISTTEAMSVYRIDVSECEIHSLDGIQYFQNIQYLECPSNQLDSLNVSMCTLLKYLDCSGNNMKYLDVSGCTQLTTILWYKNSFEYIDLGNASPQKYCYYYDRWSKYPMFNSSYKSSGMMFVGYVAFLQDSPRLKFISNKITKLDVGHNDLQVLDVKCPNLQELYCEANPLKRIDVSGCNGLSLIYMKSRNHSMEYINLGDCKARFGYSTESPNEMRQFPYLEGTVSTQLKIISSNVESLSVNGEKLELLDVSGCPALTTLHCSNNNLTNLDVSNNTQLKTLWCDNNLLTNLDLSNNSALEQLLCSSNQLECLDVSQTNLGNSSGLIDCSPMESLQKLILKAGWEIKGININRDSKYIPHQTEIVYWRE